MVSNTLNLINDPGNSLKRARPVRLTNAVQVFKNSVGDGDRFDLYRFNLARSSSFNLYLRGRRNSVDVELLNRSGQLVEPSRFSSGKDHAIRRVLDAGTYYVKVIGRASNTAYQLSMTKDPGGTRRTAQPIKLGADTRTIRNSIGESDRADLYRFDLDAQSSFDLRLKGLRRNADVALLDSSGQVMMSSRRFGKKSETMRTILEAGKYYVKVLGWDHTSYQLDLSVNFDYLDSAGNSSDTSRPVTISTNGKTYRGRVGNTDTDDFYSFSVGTANNFSASLDGLSADANLELLDLNGNVVQRSSNTGRRAELLTSVLDAGAYRIRVFSSDSKSTFFNLNLSVAPQLEGITTTGSDEEGVLFTDQSLPLIRVTDFRSGNSSIGSNPRFAGIDGRGFSTVVLDTGINLNHPFFGPARNRDGINISDRIVFNFDYANHDANATDINGHGTNVASIAAGGGSFTDPATGSITNYSGVAPGANIISLKVFRDDSDTFNWGDLEQALQWVVTNAETFNIASINMSLGNRENYTTPQTLSNEIGINDELAALTARGVTVVSASGNNFFELDSSQGVSYPSADRNSLSVGAVFDANVGVYGTFDDLDGDGVRETLRDDTANAAYTTAADRITSFSQRDDVLTTVFAPGSRITGAGRESNVQQADGTFNPNFLSRKSGTSMAAPHIAGMTVLAQQLAQQFLNRRLTPAEFRQLLVSTGDVINDGDDENDNVTNTGLQFRRANMLALANAILDLRPPSDRQIDLSASSFDVVQQTFSAGDTLDVNFQIQNTELDNSYPFDVNFYLSENPDITQNDYFLGSYNINRLPSNSNTGLIPQRLTLPAASDPIWNSFQSGNAYIGMIVDGLNAVGETNENNNIVSDRLQGKLTVTINRLTGDFDNDIFPARDDSDFYTLVSFSENPPDVESFWLRSPQQSGDDIAPNWKLSQAIAQDIVPITIRVYDNDGGLAFGDDLIDIDPLGGNTDLNLFYNFITGAISGDATGIAGQRIGSRGGGDDDSGGIEFTVGFDPNA
ncbi:MAG: S8 family serine peptidase [Leptolyngbyaceae cyanobacterium SM1_4_3]|nr:S8 family serine peptidase [Leptolyngbyaceae cyanobacterium SM1_4_3]